MQALALLQETPGSTSQLTNKIALNQRLVTVLSSSENCYSFSEYCNLVWPLRPFIALHNFTLAQ